MNHHLFRSSALAATAFVALVASPAAAQDDEAEEGGWILSLGAGGRVGPKYPGADTYGFGPMPIFGLRSEGAPLPVEAPDEGAGFGFLGDDSAFDFGPTLQFQNKRQEEDVGAPVGEVGFTVEAGAFAQAFLATISASGPRAGAASAAMTAGSATCSPIS